MLVLEGNNTEELLGSLDIRCSFSSPGFACRNEFILGNCVSGVCMLVLIIS